MIFYNDPQGSEAWLENRRGVITIVLTFGPGGYFFNK